MPLASVDEWRARIGSSWCALGRPVKSRRPRYREYRYGSPPPGGGKRVKLQDDGSVSAILMFILMVVAMMTLWSLILNGYSPICTSIMLCSSLDVVLMQCALCMSLLSSSVSQPVSNIVLSVHRESKLGSGTKLEDFPYCTKFPVGSDLDLLTPGYSSYLNEKVDTKVPVASTVKRNLFRSMSNFWHKLAERVKPIKKCLNLALVKFSLILRCGDVEENPGPYDHEKDSAGGTRLTERHLPYLIQELRTHAAKWREIGVYLRFLPGELDNIQARHLLLSNAPLSWLEAMLSEWMQWAPGDSRGSNNFATLEDLKGALSDAGLGGAAYGLHISGLDDTSSWLAMPFDPDSHFTMKALDRLEYIGIINLNNLESDTKQLNDVVGIKATDLTYINLSSLLEMWIEGHASLDPTWRHLFWALREAKLSHFANQIESYLNGVVAEQETSNLDPNTDREASERGGEGFEINTEEEKHIAAVQKAMEERGAIYHTIVHGVFVGPARSGKNSVMERLLGRIPSTVSPSTGVAENIVHVKVIQKSTTFAANVKESLWSVMDSDDEAIKLSLINTDVTMEVSPSKSVISTHSSGRLPDSFISPTQLVKVALREKGKKDLEELQRHFHKTWSLYLTNTGGQMEFQEVLPLLVSGPSIFFYVFRLDRDINTRYIIEYDCEDGTKAELSKSSLTTLEDLLQTLATIAAMGTFGLQRRERPKVFIVGTHMDQLPRSQILNVDHQLQEAIKSTAHYKDLVEFASPSQLIFTVNNFSENESDFQDMRTAVERVVEREAFKMTSPAHWLIFSLVLRQIKSDVITYDQCREIARQCGLADEELDEALHFIHSKMGLIRYFPYEEIKHLVVLRPQFLFDKVTEMIINTFTFDKVGKQAMEDFKKKGIFSLEQFEAISSRTNTSMKAFEFVKLLETLRIAAPFRMNGKLMYFFPSVLTHTEEIPVIHQLTLACTPVPNVMVTFKCGYCPKGLAGALVTYLMANEMKCSESFLWKLDHETIFRNQVSFEVGPLDTIVLKISSTHLEIICTVNTKFKNRKACPLPMLCTEIYKAVDSGIKQITSDIDYVNAEHSFTFPCECKEVSTAHPGELEYVSGEPFCLTCSKTREQHDLPANHDYWNTMLRLKAKGVIIITSQPQDIDFDVDDEEKAVFNITAEGNEPLRFQWMKDDEPIEDKDNVEGTNGPKLIISHPTKVNEGQYHCIVSDDVGEKESQKVNLVLYIGITIINQPQHINFDVDDEKKAVFNITAEGNEPLRFQWMKDDKPIEDKDNVEGTNGQELTISHPKVVDEGQYHCIVSDDFGEKKSQKVNLVLEAEMSNTLSSVDLCNLDLALTEFLETMKPEMDIKTAISKSRQVTKREVVECLQRIGAHPYSRLLRKRNGVHVLLREVVKDILDKKIQEWGKEEVLPVLKIILCGVPRSGKTTFWQNLVGITQTHNQPSLSTTLAESHAIDVKVDCATLLDWKLCDGNDSNEVIAEIYRKILENESAERLHKQQLSENLHGVSEKHVASSENPHEFSEKQASATPSKAARNVSNEQAQDTPKLVSEESANEKLLIPQKLSTTKAGKSQPPPTPTPADVSTKSSESVVTIIRKEIDSIFKKLKEKPGVVLESSNLQRVKLMINLIDTGGQSAFLHLLPLLTTGNALYLIFFSYEHPLDYELTDEFEAKRGTIKLPHKYTQIDVILQALRCVSTSITGHDESRAKVLIVGTHENSCCDQTKIDDSIKEKVQPFFKKDVLQYVDVTKDGHLVLKVNNVRDSGAVTEGQSIEEEFKKHKETLDRLIDAFPQKVLSGSWLLLSIILRRLKKDVLLYEDCEYIGCKKLFMEKSDVKMALHHMHKNIGIVMHFGDVLCLQDIVICNPALIFRSISSMIIQTYYDPSAHRDDHLRFRKHAIFTYNSFVGKKQHPKLLQHDKLIVLLQHIGAIAPVKTNPTFKCTLCQNNHAHEKPTQCIHEEYILPCVLPDAMPGELRSVEECCRKMSGPLVITFEGEYTPVGGFCYLFAKLTAEQEGWELCTPPLHSSLAEDYHHRSIYRNKVTFRVDKEYYVTLISTPYCYKVFVESSECIHYFKVWKAIRALLNKCPNQAIQKKFKLAFDCTCSRNKEHFMILEPSPVSEDYSPYRLTAICETSKVTEPTFKRVAKYLAWFMELKLVREPFQVVRIEKPGDKVTLGVKCAQSKNCLYTWQKDGDAMPQNTAKLTINNFCKSDNGIYTCIVKESVSDYFEEVSTKLISDPIKEQEAHEQIIDTYRTLVATLSVSVDPKLTDPDTTTSYQWIRYKQASIDPVKDDMSHFHGANTSKITVKDLTEEHAGVYCCVVTVCGVPIHSGKAVLRVKDLFVRQPVSLDKSCCATAHFEVEVDAKEQNCKYYWHKDGNGCKSKDYIGADTPRLTIKSIRKKHEGEYHCVVTVGNSHDRVHSHKAMLTVRGNCSSALKFRCVVAVLLLIVIIMILFAVSNHNGTTSSGLIMNCSASHHEIELGNSLHLWCNASGAQTKSIHWQWFHNGTQLANGDGGVKISEDSTGQTEIKVTNTTHESGGIYTCNVTSEQSSNDTSFTVQIIVPPDPVTNSNPVNVNDSPEWEGGFSDDNSILPDKMMVSSKEAYMNEAPNMLQLYYLENKETGKPVKIIERIGSEYSSISTSLLNDKRGNIIKTIESNEEHIAERVVKEIFRRWIKGEGAPVSWKDLVEALKIANFKTLANEIIDALHTLT